MRHYEVVFLVHPDQSEQVSAMVDRYRSMVEAAQGTVHRLEDWGRRQLAYQINKIHKAHYVLMNVECELETLRELESAFRFNDAVLRSLVIKREAPVTEISPLAAEAEAEREKDRRDRERAEQRHSDRDAPRDSASSSGDVENPPNRDSAGDDSGDSSGDSDSAEPESRVSSGESGLADNPDAADAESVADTEASGVSTEEVVNANDSTEETS